MNEWQPGELFSTLRSRHECIADIWSDTVLQTGSGTHDTATAIARFNALLDQFTSILVTEPVDEHAAQTIGEELAKFHYLQPETLGKTQALLLHMFTADLPADQLVFLLPRLSRLLGALATGFNHQFQRTIIDEQHASRRALPATREQAQALVEIKQRLRLVINNFPLILFAFDQDGVLTLAEGQGTRMFDYDMKTLVGQSIYDWQSIYPQVTTNVQRAIQGEEFSTRVYLRDAVLETRYAPLRHQSGEIQGVIGVSIDITARVRAEEELARLQRAIDQRIEAERLQIAQELHDTMLQQLLGRNYMLELAQQEVCAELRSSDRICTYITRTLGETRRDALHMVKILQSLIARLQPAGLNDMGLVVALEGHLLRLQREGDLTIPRLSCDLDPQGAHVPSILARYLFRAAQEALANALQHAQASHIHLSLQVYTDEIVLMVEDNGQGFQVPARLSEFTRSSHFGLAEMAQRIELVNGEVSIWSQPGRGTEVIVRIPVTAEAGYSDSMLPPAHEPLTATVSSA
jgi:PAS domain S-box-containing protein